MDTSTSPATQTAESSSVQPAAALPLRRRHLFQLPAAAKTLLLALSWPPQGLRSHVERVLARQRHCPVELRGTESQVLASLMHDLATRNPLSEQLHRLLAERHRLACGRVARLRGLPALQQAWHERPGSESAVATLWALLTHPQGQMLDEWLQDEMQQWVYAQVRHAVADEVVQQQAQSRESALRAEADELRLRLQRQQAQTQQALQALQAELAQLRGRQLGPLALAQRSHAQAGPAAPARVRSPLRIAAQPQPPAAVAAAPTPQQTDAPAEPVPGPPAASPPGLQGRHILCVGGIQHAVARYRQRIERLGGRFEHHDGGIEDNPHALQGRLERADLVICQAGCINHAAYHRIKQHCQRTGTQCVYLERASLSRFDRALQGLPAAARGPEAGPGPLA